MIPIVLWLSAFLTSLTPRLPSEYKGDEAQELAKSARLEVAVEIVEVAYDKEERPLFKGGFGRARTAALLASIAGYETRLSPRIRSGHCRPGECDHGEAMGLMQLHLGVAGLQLKENGRFRYCARLEEDCYLGARLLNDEKMQVRFALRKLRQNGLSSYTGEGFNGPATRTRREAAEEWVASNPPPVSDVEIMEPGPEVAYE